MQEARILAVALEGLDNILKSGQEHYLKHGEENKFSLVLENEGGLELIEQLQLHPNHLKVAHEIRHADPDSFSNPQAHVRHYHKNADKRIFFLMIQGPDNLFQLFFRNPFAKIAVCSLHKDTPK
jgi:hypothetical protein